MRAEDVDVIAEAHRWKFINRCCPQTRPYNGRNVIAAVPGLTGDTLDRCLLVEGFGVVGLDGLNVEPLADDWGAAATVLAKDLSDLYVVPGRRRCQHNSHG